MLTLFRYVKAFQEENINKFVYVSLADMLEMLSAWAEQAKKLEAGEITREDYDRWRYRYPEFNTNQRIATVISQKFSDDLIDQLKQ